MYAFDIRCTPRVSADASNKVALGPALVQFNCSDYWPPVECASRKLTETETRYTVAERQALAVTWICEKFNSCLVGRRFEMETHHEPLVSILKDKDLSKVPLQVQRFKL